MTDPAVSDWALLEYMTDFFQLYFMQDWQTVEAECALHHHLSVVTLIAVAVVRNFRFVLLVVC